MLTIPLHNRIPPFYANKNIELFRIICNVLFEGDSVSAQTLQKTNKNARLLYVRH